jgi:hypothetical protein
MKEIKLGHFSHLPGNAHEAAFDEAFRLVVEAITNLENKIKELESHQTAAPKTSRTTK